MRGLPVTFWIWLGYIHVDAELVDAELDDTDIRRIPLYANLKEIGINPDLNNEVYTLEGDGIPPLPVGLDFQILSVNGGMQTTSILVIVDIHEYFSRAWR